MNDLVFKEAVVPRRCEIVGQIYAEFVGNCALLGLKVSNLVKMLPFLH